MLFNWQNFLNLSVQLASGVSEAEWRSAISRAYYAVYHISRRFACSQAYSEPAHGRHQALIKWFKCCAEREYKVLGMGIERLYVKRLIADYNDKQAVAKKDAEAAINEAKLLLARLRGLSSV
ncbi:MAG TPA: hypothetical protein GXX55_03115 [Firmicutes bacterium]|nr:hypothetical protein [Bacillota bacterium]